MVVSVPSSVLQLSINVEVQTKATFPRRRCPPPRVRDPHGSRLAVARKALLDAFIVLHFSKMPCCRFATSV